MVDFNVEWTDGGSDMGTNFNNRRGLTAPLAYEPLARGILPSYLDQCAVLARPQSSDLAAPRGHALGTATRRRHGARIAASVIRGRAHLL